MFCLNWYFFNFIVWSIVVATVALRLRPIISQNGGEPRFIIKTNEISLLEGIVSIYYTVPY